VHEENEAWWWDPGLSIGNSKSGLVSRVSLVDQVFIFDFQDANANVFKCQGPLKTNTASAKWGPEKSSTPIQLCPGQQPESFAPLTCRTRSRTSPHFILPGGGETAKGWSIKMEMCVCQKYIHVYYIILYYITLHYITLHYIILYYIMLCYIILILLLYYINIIIILCYVILY